MRLKSYFASTVEAAMALARQEMGEEAMLVNSRRTSQESRQFGEYEVVFASALQEALTESLGTAPSAGASGHSTPNEMGERLAIQIAGLKRQIERMSSNFARARVGNRTGSRMRADAARLLALLLDADVDEEIAAEIATRVGEHPVPQEAFAEVMGQMIRCDSSLGRPGKARRIIAVVGPPGCGKTTTLVKLATRYGVASKRPAQILSTDWFRIAAADQLRSYASILGIGFQCVDSPHALSVALEEHRHKEIIFIDTPGLSARDMEDGTGLASVLAAHSEVDTHLIAPASMRASDLTRTLQRFEVFSPKKLIFTKLDETDSPGALVNEAVRMNLPVSFMTAGQQVPEDLEEASLNALLGLITRTTERETAVLRG